MEGLKVFPLNLKIFLLRRSLTKQIYETTGWDSSNLKEEHSEKSVYLVAKGRPGQVRKFINMIKNQIGFSNSSMSLQDKISLKYKAISGENERPRIDTSGYRVIKPRGPDDPNDLRHQIKNEGENQNWDQQFNKYHIDRRPGMMHDPKASENAGKTPLLGSEGTPAVNPTGDTHVEIPEAMETDETQPKKMGFVEPDQANGAAFIRDATAPRGFHQRTALNKERPVDARQFILGCNLVVKDVNLCMTQKNVEEMFGQCGPITSMRMIKNPGGDTYMVLIAFTDPKHAKAAIEMYDGYQGPFAAPRKRWGVDYNRKDKRDMARNEMYEQMSKNQINHVNFQELRKKRFGALIKKEVGDDAEEGYGFGQDEAMFHDEADYFDAGYRPQIHIPDNIPNLKQRGDNIQVGCNLCIRNLHPHLTREQILEPFLAFGEITMYHRMITKTGVCLALISYATPMQAQKARINMHANRDLCVRGKVLMVDYTIDDKKKMEVKGPPGANLRFDLREFEKL